MGLVICFPFGIVAWVMGNGDMKAIDAGLMGPEGRGMTQAGKILGIITTVLIALSLAIGLVMFLMALLLPAVANS